MIWNGKLLAMILITLLTAGIGKGPGQSRAEMPGSGILAIPDFFTSFKSKGTPVGRMPQTFQKIGPTEGTGF